LVRKLAVIPVFFFVLVAAGCGGGEETTGQAGADLAHGKELFTSGCAQCHVLADAGANGQVGPNLDEAFGHSREQGFDESTFFDVVHAQIDIPAESGSMPADIYTGQDAVDVAAYVASVAGTGASPAPPPQGGTPPPPEPPPATEPPAGTDGSAQAEGKEVFASAGCGSCHTLGDAGSSGDVGPNLDDAQPPAELVVERVTNGKGVMPSFRDQLSEEQIRAVADYVSSVAGSP
jgi:mono/diheme cytochrome c family protein